MTKLRALARFQVMGDKETTQALDEERMIAVLRQVTEPAVRNPALRKRAFNHFIMLIANERAR